MRLAELGFANAGLYLCDRVLQRLTGGRAFLQRYYLVVQPVDQGPRLPRRLGAGLAVRQIEAGDAALGAMARPAAVIADRYSQGSTCLALFEGDLLAAFAWLCDGPYEEDEVRCRFVPEPAGAAAWDYDLHVAPERRGSIAFLKLWSAVMEHLRARGIAWSASRISAFAPASVAAHRRLGAVRVGQAFFLVMLRLQLMLATVPPYLHVSMRRDRRPTLRVRAPDIRPGSRRVPGD